MARISAVLKTTKELVDSCVDEEGHDFSHVCAVTSNAQRMILHSPLTLTATQKEAILLASILHDVDDPKLFPGHECQENARIILDSHLEPYEQEQKNLVLFMIDIVSASKNGNHNHGIDLDTEWMLYPRYADRLEGIGRVGIKRAKLYSLHTGRPMYTDLTKRATTEEELWEIATPERFLDYINKRKCHPYTHIDHFYDKVLHIGKPEVFEGVCKNSYVLEEAAKRHREVVDYILMFGKVGLL